jgi:hypothetical protein
MSKGYVYILTNECMPGLVKIGRTTRSVEGRANELYQTGVPAPFDVLHSVLSPDCATLEAWLHEALSDLRVNASREFFRIDAKSAIAKLNELQDEQLSTWLEELAPGKTLVDELACIDAADVHLLAHRLDVSTMDVANAFYLITPEEFRPALERYNVKCAERRAARLKVVGE